MMRLYIHNYCHSVFLKCVIILAIICSYSPAAQSQVVVDTFDLPPGYTTLQTLLKNTLKVDPSDNIWIGFKRIGAGKFNGTNWTVYDTSNGLPSINVLCFAFSGNTVWAGTDKGLAKYNGISWTIYDSLNSGLTTNYIKSLFVDGSDLWVGTKKGAFLFDGLNWTHYTTTNSGLRSDTVNCFARSGNDTIWIGSHNGLVKFYNGAWKTYNVFNSINTEYNSITKLVTDTSENIWIEINGQSVFGRLNEVLYQDSIHRLSSFVSFCDGNAPSGYLIGLNSYGNITLTSTQIFEININPINIVHTLITACVGGNNICTDLDSNGKIWSTSAYNSGSCNTGLKLIRVDYHSALQPNNANPYCHTLDVNQVQAYMLNNGSMFWDLNSAKYEVPKGSGIMSMFVDDFWIGGLDASGQLHQAAQTYRQSGSDFWPGPLDTTNATTDWATVQQYDSIWKIDRSTIDEFITQFDLGNVTNGSYPIPGIIIRWPAQGTGNHSRNLAPFVDINHDGLYNPYDGDYPAIKGDQMLWWVFNDNLTTHNKTNGLPLGIEVHCSAYAFGCSAIQNFDEAINYTTFYHTEIFNRSDSTYSQVYMGRMTDPDLGNYLDDYVGCDTILNISFAYNGDNFDDGITGYGINPPMINLLYLNDTITHFQYFNNDNTIMGVPDLAQDYYNYLHSTWKDGAHVSYGGNGHGTGLGATNIPTNFMLPGNPYSSSPSVWNETTSGNAPDDRRFVTSTGPFNFPAHSEKDFDFAYVWTRDADHPNGLTTSWAKNVHDVLKIKQWYASDSFPCNNIDIGIHELNNPLVSFNLYPNPAHQSITLFISSKKNSVYTMELTDITGRKIRTGIVFPNRNNELRLDEVSSGIYFIKISDKETSAVKKFIRQ